jgi:hypothetical protein
MENNFTTDVLSIIAEYWIQSEINDVILSYQCQLDNINRKTNKNKNNKENNNIDNIINLLKSFSDHELNKTFKNYLNNFEYIKITNFLSNYRRSTSRLRSHISTTLDQITNIYISWSNDRNKSHILNKLWAIEDQNFKTQDDFEYFYQFRDYQLSMKFLEIEHILFESQNNFYNDLIQHSQYSYLFLHVLASAQIYFSNGDNNNTILNERLLNFYLNTDVNDENNILNNIKLNEQHLKSFLQTFLKLLYNNGNSNNHNHHNTNFNKYLKYIVMVIQKLFDYVAKQTYEYDTIIYQRDIKNDNDNLHFQTFLTNYNFKVPKNIHFPKI